MQATVFVCRSRGNRDLIGVALVSVEVKYIGVRWLDADGVERRLTSLERWRDIGSAMRVGLPPSPLPSAEPLASVVLGEHGFHAELLYLTTIDIRVDPTDHAVEALDAALEAEAVRLGVRRSADR